MPGANNTVARPSSPVPVPQHTVGGGEERWIDDAILVTNVPTGNFTQATASFYVDIPSPRLAVGVTVSYRLDSGEGNPLPTTAPNAWTIVMDAWNQTRSGLWIKGNNILPGPGVATAQILPVTWEASTMVRQWRGTVTVNPSAAQTGVAPGRLYVVAVWEPIPGQTIDPATLRKMFQACKVYANGITTSQTAT